MIDECDYKEEISFKLARVETDDGDMIFVLPVGSSSIPNGSVRDISNADLSED